MKNKNKFNFIDFILANVSVLASLFLLGIFLIESRIATGLSADGVENIVDLITVKTIILAISLASIAVYSYRLKKQRILQNISENQTKPESSHPYFNYYLIELGITLLFIVVCALLIIYKFGL